MKWAKINALAIIQVEKYEKEEWLMSKCKGIEDSTTISK